LKKLSWKKYNFYYKSKFNNKFENVLLRLKYLEIMEKFSSNFINKKIKLEKIINIFYIIYSKTY
jgi:hypothetical protein